MTLSPKVRAWRVVEQMHRFGFGLLLVLVLAAYSGGATRGPLSWAPLWQLPGMADMPANPGPLALLPALILFLWIASRALARPRTLWSWGNWRITFPLLGLTVLVLFGLDFDLGRRATLQTALTLGLAWFVYLYVVNEKPKVVMPLVLAVALQGTVAVGQFISQRDLGLTVLGEMPLDRSVPGISVLLVMGQRYLRSYGLTGHPNLLATTIVVILLLLMPVLWRSRGSRQVLLGLALLLGFLGLLFSFSRAGWIGLVVGTFVLLKCERMGRVPTTMAPVTRHLRSMYVVMTLVLVLFALSYHDLLASRFLIGSGYTEDLSLSDRWRDAGLALGIIVGHPWQGVGAGNYLETARAQDEGAQIVHNVPLLVTAELGLPGGALWLGLVVASFWGLRDVLRKRSSEASSCRCTGEGLAALAPWFAYLVIGLFDYNPWPLVLMRGAFLFGLLAAGL